MSHQGLCEGAAPLHGQAYQLRAGIAPYGGVCEALVRIGANRDLIIRQAEGNPRQLLAAARDVVLRGSEEALAADRVVASASELGATEALAVRYLIRHGPTSASDEKLLDALDITRARATQVFRRLEDADLVYASNEKAHNLGRPRRLYATRLSHRGVS